MPTVASMNSRRSAAPPFRAGLRADRHIDRDGQEKQDYGQQPGDHRGHEHRDDVRLDDDRVDDQHNRGRDQDARARRPPPASPSQARPE
jgi:hypothetical protein